MWTVPGNQNQCKIYGWYTNYPHKNKVESIYATVKQAHENMQFVVVVFIYHQCDDTLTFVDILKPRPEDYTIKRAVCHKGWGVINPKQHCAHPLQAWPNKDLICARTICP